MRPPLPGFYDGDTGPVYRFRCKDDGAAQDQAIMAVEMYIYDTAGVLLARRVGLPVSPKVNGFIDLILLGKECDWDGLGKNLIVKPKVYALVSPVGDAGVNLLSTPSFDTDGNADGIADNWALQGTKTGTWSLITDDPFPCVVFGSAQQVKHAGLADPDYVQQSAAATIAAGDRYSWALWHRSNGAGGTLSDTHAVFARFGSNPNTYSRFRVGTNDWYVVTGSIVATQGETAWTLGIDARGTTLDNRFDDAFFGKGEIRLVPVEPLQIPVYPRSVPPRNQNQVRGIGSFEQDSNADGCADGWSKANASGVTFTMEYAPANVYEGRASQKITLANFTGKFLRHIHRKRYVAGETWRMSVRVKTNGALTGSPSSGQWGIRVSTDDFEDVAPQQNGTIADFGTNLAAFTLYQSDIVIAATCSSLRLDVFVNGVTGSAWIDDVHLERVAP